ncbi:hypothetical protein HETIRDRAFT_325249 [Heterobasidion irregulare TC 32-1]|uniref:C2H2-type domain-containing protein n=1 Tax=Heterobasidion irregulare (strain TC 32-1) TaxID=747525 RepID=W4JXN2_HETIT|nr:uncharacterized protein HETIRDRAFT_325249 [Heterobasidion irregulare TC 32-1]ETW77830.1 hypothetical protein HETIRDRAFT_325249 [Heterobasidion irregulare TC 32-1]
MGHDCDVPSFENFINCKRKLQDVPDDVITSIINQHYFDTTFIDPDSLAESPSFSLSPASSYSGDSSGYPADTPDQEPTYITTDRGLDYLGAVPLSTLHPDIFCPNEDTIAMGQIYQGGISPSDIFLAQQSYPDLEYLTDGPEQMSACFNDSQGFISDITAQPSSTFPHTSYSPLSFSQPNEDSIAMDPISQEGIPPSHVVSATQPYPDLQQTTGPLRRFPCKHCDRSFATRWNLKTHMNLHNPNRMKPFACTHEGCHYASARKNDLKRHMGSCSHA